MSIVERTIITTSPQATAELAARLGRGLQGAALVFLTGTLGAGKTQFAQGLAVGLEIANPLVSPTFTLSVPYYGRLPLLHVDAYRFNIPEGAAELGIDDALDEGSVVLVEWAERIQDELRPPDLRIQISIVSETERNILFQLSASASNDLQTAFHKLA
jgi:tRNA threonylcarbamoyladenosine biosynthesis protein TsaE